MAEQSLHEARRRRSRIKLYLVIAICATPVFASYYAYYFVRPDARSNYGELIDPQRPMPPLHLKTLDGRAFDHTSLRGKWVMLMVAGGDCAAACVDRLYHLRQVRLTTGKDRDRVERVWLIPDQAPLSTKLMREYDGTEMLRADPGELATWLSTDPAARASYADHIYMVDPLGNLMMQFPVDADPNKTKRDLAKLLRASRIG
ncbi:MAG: cytochrome C oxidase subunit I [Burkholderiaceae bacterium]